MKPMLTSSYLNQSVYEMNSIGPFFNPNTHILILIMMPFNTSDKCDYRPLSFFSGPQQPVSSVSDDHKKCIPSLQTVS